VTDYIKCPLAEVPGYLRWDVPARNQGQIVEIAYACDRYAADEACPGDEYQRVTDQSVPTGSAARTRYYRRADVAPWQRWTTWGPVRDRGDVHATREDAEADLARDRKGCSRQGGYSDRAVYRIDRDGYLLDGRGCNIWPSSGRSSGAVRVTTSEMRP